MSSKAAAKAPSNQAVFRETLKSVLGSVSPATRQVFVTAVNGPAEDDLDPSMWGPAPDPDQRREAALANLRQQYDVRRQVIDASLTRPEVSQLLDVSEQAVLDRLEAGDLVGLKKGREWRLPAWQFSADAERGFVPGISRLLEVFPGGIVTLSEWATRPHVELAGATPVAELVAGRVDEVLAAAQAASLAAW